MRLTTSIGWHRPWLRRVVAYCCRQLGYPGDRLAAARFTLCHNARYRGWAYCSTHSVRVKINPLNAYPLTRDVPRSLPAVALADPVEVLVLITAHEVAHLERWDRFARRLRAAGERDTRLEADTERHARRVLKDFRDRRPSLTRAWGESGPGPVAPAVVHRLSCRTCGWRWEAAARPTNPTRRSCRTCFRSWKAAAAADQFLAYERVPCPAPIPIPSSPDTGRVAGDGASVPEAS